MPDPTLGRFHKPTSLAQLTRGRGWNSELVGFLLPFARQDFIYKHRQGPAGLPLEAPAVVAESPHRQDSDAHVQQHQRCVSQGDDHPFRSARMVYESARRSD